MPQILERQAADLAAAPSDSEWEALIQSLGGHQFWKKRHTRPWLAGNLFICIPSRKWMA